MILLLILKCTLFGTTSCQETNFCEIFEGLLECVMEVNNSCFVENARNVSGIEVLREEDFINEKSTTPFEDFRNVSCSSANLTKLDDTEALCIEESCQATLPQSHGDQTNLFAKQETNDQATSVQPDCSDLITKWTKNSNTLLAESDSLNGKPSNREDSLDSQNGVMCRNNYVIFQQNASELCSYDQDGKVLLVSKKHKPGVSEVVLGSNETVINDSLNIDYSHFLVGNSEGKISLQFYDNVDSAAGRFEHNQSRFNYGEGDKFYDCPSCFYTTQKRDKLDRHIQRHVLLEGYHPCGKKRHAKNTPALRYRHNAEEYRCRFCPYTCTVYKAYKKHRKAHMSGNTESCVKLSCKICGKDRSSDAELQKHMKKHRDGKLFLCDVCKFGSAQLKKIIQHRRMHTGEKPHLCPHCNYRSSRRDNLRSHVRRKHKKENMYIDTFNPPEHNSSDVSD